MTVIHNDGKGAFAVADEHVSTGVRSRGSIGAGDIDGDGDVDIVTPGTIANLGVHTNRGDGMFDPINRYATLASVRGIALADFNGDGRPDIVAGGADIGALTYLGNLGPSLCAADFNGDGSLDVLDFVAFQQAFVAGDASADCDGDGALTNPGDFVCFQRLFRAGCR